MKCTILALYDTLKFSDTWSAPYLPSIPHIALKVFHQKIVKALFQKWAKMNFSLPLFKNYVIQKSSLHHIPGKLNCWYGAIILHVCACGTFSLNNFDAFSIVLAIFLGALQIMPRINVVDYNINQLKIASCGSYCGHNIHLWIPL